METGSNILDDILNTVGGCDENTGISIDDIIKQLPKYKEVVIRKEVQRLVEIEKYFDRHDRGYIVSTHGRMFMNAEGYKGKTKRDFQMFTWQKRTYCISIIVLILTAISVIFTVVGLPTLRDYFNKIKEGRVSKKQLPTIPAPQLPKPNTK